MEVSKLYRSEIAYGEAYDDLDLLLISLLYPEENEEKYRGKKRRRGTRVKRTQSFKSRKVGKKSAAEKAAERQKKKEAGAAKASAEKEKKEKKKATEKQKKKEKKASAEKEKKEKKEKKASAKKEKKEKKAAERQKKKEAEAAKASVKKDKKASAEKEKKQKKTAEAEEKAAEKAAKAEEKAAEKAAKAEEKAAKEEERNTAKAEEKAAKKAEKEATEETAIDGTDEDETGEDETGEDETGEAEEDKTRRSLKENLEERLSDSLTSLTTSIVKHNKEIQKAKLMSNLLIVIGAIVFAIIMYLTKEERDIFSTVLLVFAVLVTCVKLVKLWILGVAIFRSKNGIIDDWSRKIVARLALVVTLQSLMLVMLMIWKGEKDGSLGWIDWCKLIYAVGMLVLTIRNLFKTRVKEIGEEIQE